MKALTDILTDSDGAHDTIRWAAALGVLVAVLLTIWDVIVQHAHFDIQAFGIGFGTLLGATGAGLALKSKEPPAASSS